MKFTKQLSPIFGGTFQIHRKNNTPASQAPSTKVAAAASNSISISPRRFNSSRGRPETITLGISHRNPRESLWLVGYFVGMFLFISVYPGIANCGIVAQTL